MQAAVASAAAAMLTSRGRATEGGTLITQTPSIGWGTFGKPRRILEIFLRGGASMWGSFWFDDVLGGDAGTRDTTLSKEEWQAITGGGAPTTNSWCGGTIGKAAGPMFRLKNNPATGTNRKLADFMRVIRVGHGIEAHEVGIPYAATGTTLGRKKAAGLGVACSRRDRESTPPGPLPDFTPRALILQTGTKSGDNRAATNYALCGLHDTINRPPIIKLGDTSFYDALNRADPAADRTDTDGIKKFFRDRYGSKMKIGAQDARSEGWTGYASSFDTLINSYAALRALLSIPGAGGAMVPNPLIFDAPPAEADINYYNNNLPRRAIKAAIGMLKDPTNKLQHVAVIDGGVKDDYDTHSPDAAHGTAAQIQNGNIWNVCDTLAIHLNDILDNGIAVLIHSEFGRKEKEKGHIGTEHYAAGYSNVVISDMVIPGFSGYTTNGNSEADLGPPPPFGNLPQGDLGHLTPTDVHAAVAQHLAGIAPWQDDMFDPDLAGTTVNGSPCSNIGVKLFRT